MSFVVQRESGRSAVARQFDVPVLRIGRGTNCEVRSENAAVSLLHATIQSDARGYTITDRGSITGTYVNGRVVESTALAKGDTIQIGDLTIEIQLADPGRPMFVRIRSSRTEDAGQRAYKPKSEVVTSGGAVEAERIDYAAALQLRRPYFKRITITALLLLFTFVIASEIVRPERQDMFAPGLLSSAHMKALDANGNPIARNCGACHEPWKSVTEVKCAGCHGRLVHAPRQAGGPTCMECHAEHRGVARLAQVGDTKCTSCHSDLQNHINGTAPPAISPRITAFGGEHPEFKPVSDPSTLRFNHRLHLKTGGILGAGGRKEVLTCNSCHRLVETRAGYDPIRISYEAACQRCHRLTFDARFPDAEIPHGVPPGTVLGFVITTYQGNRSTALRSGEEIGRIIAAGTRMTVDERILVNARNVVKVTCQKCHPVQPGEQNLVTVTRPVFRARWLERIRFRHTNHRRYECETCHDSARGSAATADVLIPSRAKCLPCHGSPGAAASSCVSCHAVYHDRSNSPANNLAVAARRRTSAMPIPPPTGDVTGMLESLLLYGSVILLLVIFIPVAFGIFSRLKASSSLPTGGKVRPPARVEPPAPPPQPERRGPEKSVPERVAPPPIAPAGPPAAAETSIVDVDAAIHGAGTAMVEWYGMLVCVGGPLAGQRWVIEEKPLTIGRDANFAQIVIRDDRISKLHVKIEPRNGKVLAIDPGSTNGTYIDKIGERITSVELKRNMKIILADNAAVFEYQI